MKTFSARVYVRNGNAKVPHTVQFNAQSSFAAQQMLTAQYGANNVISVPIEITSHATTGSKSPWMIKIG
jgi:hypothetical protein